MRYRRSRVPAAWVLTACCLATGVIAGCAGQKPIPATDVPAALNVPGDHVLTAALHGTGVQIYECRTNPKDPKGFIWWYTEPKADLSDRSGKDIGRHYAGPTWEAYDGSTVVADIQARVNAPNPGAIQWLLLRAKTNAGKGTFGKTRFIQRLHTIGGLAPTDPCDARHLGQRTRVPYSADYYFYNSRR
jgi:hypothetical protein